jgi:hypothetical protein
MSAECNLVVLPLDCIRLDGGTQIRAAINEDVVSDYAALVANQVHLPPLCVFQDGEIYWLVDGFHRWHALKKNGRTEALCHVYRGSQRDALLAAVRTNHAHGLRRTNEDKRRAVEVLLGDTEWAQKGDRWIAEMAGVSHPFVSSIRSQVATVTTSQKGGAAEPALVQGRDGKLYPRVARRRQSDGVETPLDRIDAALQAALAFDACLTRLTDLSRAGDKLARGPAGGYFERKLAEYQDHAKRMAQLLAESRPRTRCGACSGAGCEACLALGYVCG